MDFKDSMRKLLEVLFVSLCLIGVLGACKGGGERKGASERLEGLRGEPVSDRDKIIELVFAWSEAFNNKDVEALRTMYDTVVYSPRECGYMILYEAYKYTADEYVKTRIEYFEEHPDSKWEIEGEIRIVPLKEDGLVQIYFAEVSDEDVVNEAVSPPVSRKAEKILAPHLVVRKDDDGWKIRAESDFITADLLVPLEAQIPDYAVKGDFNGDGIVDYMWTEFVRDDGEWPLSECKIRFSGGIPSVISCCQDYGGWPENLGDLNDDGTDEIGYLPHWHSSAWHVYHVLSLKEDRWKEILIVRTWFPHLEDGMQPVVKHETRKGYVIVNESDLNEDHSGIVIKTRTVKLK